MTVKAKTFYVDTIRSGPLDAVTAFIQSEVGLEGDNVLDIQAVKTFQGVVQLTILYRDKLQDPVLAAYPPPGSIINQEATPTHASILFSSPLDVSSLNWSSFQYSNATGLTGNLTGVLATGGFTSQNDGYIAHINLPDEQIASPSYNKLFLDADSLYYTDGDKLQYSSILGFSVDSNTSPREGQEIPYTANLGRRGLVTIEGLILDKKVLPSDRISEFLIEKGIGPTRLIDYASVDLSNGRVYIFFAYFSTLEPQLVRVYPYMYSMSLLSNKPDKVIFSFKEPLDINYIKSQNGLFKLYTDYNTVVEIVGSQLTVSSDGKTVSIPVSVLVDLQGEDTVSLYDVRISGLKSADGTNQTRDILYCFQTAALPSGGSDVSGSVTGITGAGAGVYFEDVNSRILGIGATDSTISVAADGISVNVAAVSHSSLADLSSDDHTLYARVDGTRGFEDVAGGKTPTDTGHLVTKKYVDDNIAAGAVSSLNSLVGAVSIVGGNAITISTTSNISVAVDETAIDHGTIGGLTDDDHTQYTRVDGTRGFEDVMGGKTPTATGHLATKNYVDSANVISINSSQGAISFLEGTLITIGTAGTDITFSVNEGSIDHGSIAGLSDDDHTQYSRVDGGRGFVDTVGGKTPTATGHLATKSYVDSNTVTSVNTAQGGITILGGTLISIDTAGTNITVNVEESTIDHGNIGGLTNDDHVQYSLIDGTRGYEGVVGGKTPTATGHLVTKQYADSIAGVTSIEGLAGVVDLAEGNGISIIAGGSTITIGVNQSQISHSNLSDLTSDDHTQYILANATRTFEAFPVVNEGTPLEDLQNYSLVPKQYVDNLSVGFISTPESSNDFGSDGAVTGLSGSVFFSGSGIGIDLVPFTGTGIAFGSNQNIMVFYPELQDNSLEVSEEGLRVLWGNIVHSGLGGLTVSDDHTQYIYTAPTTDSRNVIGNDYGGMPLSLKDGLALGDETHILEIQDSAGDDVASITAVGTVFGRYGSFSQGITSSGNIDAKGNQITNVGWPATTGAAANKRYIDYSLTGLSGTFTSHTGNSSYHFLISDISHTDIQDIGTYTHTQIDDHISSTSNPHSITIGQIGGIESGQFNYLSGEHTTHTGDLSNPHSVTVGQVGGINSGQFSYLSGQHSAHSGDSDIHFTVTSINHDDIQNVGVNSHATIDSHILSTDNPHSVTVGQAGGIGSGQFSYLSGEYVAHTGNTAIHFEIADIVHGDIQDVGTNTHAQIDTHISSTNNPHSVTTSQIGALSGQDLVEISGFITGELVKKARIENGIVSREDNIMSFDSATREFSIQPTGDRFVYHTFSEVYYCTGAKVTIDDAEGLNFIYFSGTGLISDVNGESYIETIIKDFAFLCAVYWDEHHKTGVGVGDERHGVIMDSATHTYNHVTYGSRYGDGLGLINLTVDGDGNSDDTARFGVTDGTIWDEDIRHAIENGNPQTISPTGYIPVLYMTGSEGVWRKHNPTEFPIMTTGSGRPAFNDFNAGVWEVAEITNNDFLLTHYLATNDIYDPIVCIMGQGDYGSLNEARAGAETELANLTLTYLTPMLPEFIPIATVIWQCRDVYSNAVKARIVSTTEGFDYIDWRISRNAIAAGGSTASDHGNLAGLSDDDHPQYPLTDGTRGFGGVVTGVYPTSDTHLSTKQYVDDITEGLSGTFVSHTGNTAIHFEIADILHGDIQDVGTNTHAQIDTHIASIENPHSVTVGQAGGIASGQFNYLSGQHSSHSGDLTLHYTVASIDHGSIAGLADDDHTQYIHTDPSSATRNLISNVTSSPNPVLTLQDVYDAGSVLEVKNSSNDINFTVSFDGSVSCTTLDVNSSNIINVANPAASHHAVPEGYLVTSTGAIHYEMTGISGHLQTGIALVSGYLDDKIDSLGAGTTTPIGVVQMYAGVSSTPPTNWLYCTGQEVSRTTYSELFTVIGTAYGVGDGSTTFNIPHFGGRAPIGVGSHSGIFTGVTGETTGRYDSILPSHSHDIPYLISQKGQNADVYVLDVEAQEANTTPTSEAGESIIQPDLSNMQPSLAINFIIYAGA